MFESLVRRGNQRIGGVEVAAKLFGKTPKTVYAWQTNRGEHQTPCRNPIELMADFIGCIAQSNDINLALKIINIFLERCIKEISEGGIE